MKTFLILGALALTVTALPAAAHHGDRHPVLDRIEDRIDRRENRIDRRTDNGPLDRLEDRIDRAEDILDRNGVERPFWIDRHERRTWRRLWGQGRD